MKFKKLLLTAFFIIAILTPGFSSDGTIPVSNNTATETPEIARGKELLNRLEEIKAMDKSDLSKAEKKNLRKEVRSIENEMKELNGGGLYISVGGISIILLVVFLLL
jgi:hypothetical protein